MTGSRRRHRSPSPRRRRSSPSPRRQRSPDRRRYRSPRRRRSQSHRSTRRRRSPSPYRRRYSSRDGRRSHGRCGRRDRSRRRYSSPRDRRRGSSRRNGSSRRRRSPRRESSSSDDRRGGSASSYDSTLGQFEGLVGEKVGDRYTICGVAGRGTFGRVLDCEEGEGGRRVAIKVVRKVRRYCSEAKIEADIIKAMNLLDPQAQWPVVRLFEWFEFEGHACLVFEKLGPSLYDFVKANDGKSFLPPHVQSFTQQLTQALCFLHHNGLVHTDLKPEYSTPT
eukprot:TRINITY_DN8376_c0_g1_i2.p1 TRINITY_DN8376_c0_g1~~TRINITY_DN8376_c0_g1_i2.p1  ORF type:complete len:278 (-),score=15.59 TRINITY_DN8376_c0_g1_i2:192-1025(-)